MKTIILTTIGISIIGYVDFKEKQYIFEAKQELQIQKELFEKEQEKLDYFIKQIK